MSAITPRRIAGLVVLLLLAALSGTALAQRDSSLPRPPSGKLTGGPQGSAPNAPVDVMVELDGAPAAAAAIQARRRGASRTAAARSARAQRAGNDQAQRSVLERARRRGLADRVIFGVGTAYNGVAVRTTRAGMRRLAALDGVKSVRVLTRFRPDNLRSVRLTNAPAAWAGVSGRRGAGIKVGIVDTGIDYTHANFGGSGTQADYDLSRATGNNPAAADSAPSGFRIEDADGRRQVFPTAKVAGGFDFAGDSYGAGNTPPAPDPNPNDCNGHGSHVAGTAAGLGVKADGSTFAGPFADPLPASLKIGPGMAPDAKLYALRVFGCSGSTVLVPQALDWAVDPNHDGDTSDRLDVVNLSLGGAFGGEDNSSAVAADLVAQAGVVVVGSAGNDGDVTAVMGGPGGARRAISVAATQASQRVDGFEVTAPAEIAGFQPATEGTAFNWAASSPVTANLYYPATNQTGCSAWSGADAANISGRIVLVDWRAAGQTTQPCGSSTRAGNASNAGAAGIIMADNVDGFQVSISGSPLIRAMYTSAAVGAKLKSALTAGQVSGVSVKLSHEYADSATDAGAEDLIYANSSRGPASPDGSLKPDLAAPGQDIVSTDEGTGTGGIAFNGTSMAAPHVAGEMALLKEAHPGWTVEELKARAMNSAIHDVHTGVNRTGIKHSPQRIGAGRIDAKAALADDVIAYGEDAGAVSLSFGPLEVGGTLTREKTVRVVNGGTADRTFGVGYDARSEVPGASYTFPDGASVAVPAGGEATFRVRLTAEADQLLYTPDPALPSPTTLHALLEASGNVVLTPQDGGAELRVPAHASLRPAATMHADAARIDFDGASATGELTLAGTPIDNAGAGISGVRGAAFPFELQAIDAKEDLGSGAERLREADVHYAGAISNAPQRIAAGQSFSGSGSFVAFGIATWRRWMLPAAPGAEFDIYIDANRDGTDDYAVWNARPGTTDQFVVGVAPIGGAGEATYYLNAYTVSQMRSFPFNSDVMTIPVPVAKIGLSQANPRFNYSIRAYSGNTLVDTIGNLTYDPLNPGLTTGTAASPQVDDLPGTKIAYGLDRAKLDANRSKGILLLHYLNAAGKRAEPIRVNQTNNAPDARAAAVSPVIEGDGLSLDAGASTDADVDDTLSYDWDVDGDGAFGDATGATPSLSAARMAELGLGDGPKEVSAAVKVSDGRDDRTATTTVNVLNAPPTATVSDPAGPVDPGETVTLNVAGTDPSATDAAALKYKVRWEGLVSGPEEAGPDVTHAYDHGGSYTVKVWSVDKDGAESAVPAETTVTVRRKTATAVACSPAKVAVNRPTTCTVTVADDDTGTTARPEGSVTFSGGKSCTLPATGETRCAFVHRPAAEGSEDVTATFAGDTGHAPSTGTRTLTVTPPAPESQSPPVVSGARKVGATLTATGDSWRNDPARFRYSWLRCDANGWNCTPIGTADATDDADYTLVPDDSGRRIRAGVRAINAYGFLLRTSLATVAIGTPAMLTRPTISGARQVGMELTASPGTWDPAADRYEHQWLRCSTAGSACVPVGTDSASYTPEAADAGHRLRVRVTAINAAGRAIGTSTASSIVGAPAIVRWPSIGGVKRVGSLLIANPGAWEPAAEDYDYRWLRCDRFGLMCTTVATGSAEYTPADTDEDHRLRVWVTASNGAGATTVSSPASPLIGPAG